MPINTSQVRAHYKDLIVCGTPAIMDRAMSMPRSFWNWLSDNYVAGSRIYMTERHLNSWKG